MRQNTAGQRMLHPDLICAAAESIIKIGENFGALGHKINGAGGDGGSVTLLTDGDPQTKIELAQAITHADSNWKIIPIKLASQGVIISP